MGEAGRGREGMGGDRGGREGTGEAGRGQEVPAASPPPAGKALSGPERRATQAALDAIVCHTPLTNLGSSRKGSARTIRVAFQALRAGLFEVGEAPGGGREGRGGEDGRGGEGKGGWMGEDKWGTHGVATGVRFPFSPRFVCVSSR